MSASLEGGAKRTPHRSEKLGIWWYYDHTEKEGERKCHTNSETLYLVQKDEDNHSLAAPKDLLPRTIHASRMSTPHTAAD